MDGGVLIAGLPAHGPRTAAFALVTLSRSYAAFPALRVGPDDGIDSVVTPARHLAELRSWAQLLVEFRRGATTFCYDRERLGRLREQGRLPVVATDEPRVVDALLRESDRWFAVLLREAPAPARMWTQPYALTVRTDLIPAAAAGQVIHAAVQSRPDPDEPG